MLWSIYETRISLATVYNASYKVRVEILTHTVAYDESVNYNACKSVITTDSCRSKTTSVLHAEPGILEHAPCSSGL